MCLPLPSLSLSRGSSDRSHGRFYVVLLLLMIAAVETHLTLDVIHVGFGSIDRRTD